MTPKDIRTAISNQCGFNKAKHRQDLQVKLSPERLAKLESICQRHPAKQGEKTQPQRLLESIIPAPYKSVQVCNAGDWPTVEDQQRFWQERDEHLDRTEATALWFDNKAKTELPF